MKPADEPSFRAKLCHPARRWRSGHHPKHLLFCKVCYIRTKLLRRRQIIGIKSHRTNSSQNVTLLPPVSSAGKLETKTMTRQGGPENARLRSGQQLVTVLVCSEVRGRASACDAAENIAAFLSSGKNPDGASSFVLLFPVSRRILLPDFACLSLHLSVCLSVLACTPI